MDPDQTITPLQTPQIFDLIAPLHEVLNRLLTQPPTGLTSHAHPVSFPGQQPLEIQHLSGEVGVDAVKNKVKKARAVLETLPDMDRSIDEQQAEIDDLVRKIKAQQEMLRSFGQY
ncbi:MAG: hypothetical protein M1831_006214 [Alyxoria varia]|nr:MAG: hypothetical protein M1831_006214 [Alyxoria varia]